MPTLSSILVQYGAASMRAVENAIARQVLHGGDLPTNLLELTPLDEAMLTACLAESFGLASAPSGRLRAPPSGVIRVIPPDLALRHAIFPLEQHGRRLIIATAEPLSRAVHDDLGFALDLDIVELAATLVRVRQALATYYGIPLDQRLERLIARIERWPDQGADSGVPSVGEASKRRIPRALSVPAPSFGTEVSTSPSPLDEPPARPPAARGRLEDVPAKKEPFNAAPAPLPELVPETPSPASSTVILMPGPSAEIVPLALDELTPFAPPTSAPLAGEAAALRSPEGTEMLAGWVRHEIDKNERTSALLDKTRAELRGALRVVRRKGPFTTAMAEQELEAAGTTDAVLDIVFAFSAQFFEYAALFVIQGDLAEGRDAAGAGASRERVTAIGVPLDLPSSLERMRRHRAPMIGPLGAEGLDADLIRDLGRDAARPGRSVALLPLLIRGRTVAVLFGDDGESDVTLTSLGDVIAFTALAALALERILVRKKLGPRANEGPLRPPSSPPPASKPQGRPDPRAVARVRALVEAPFDAGRSPLDESADVDPSSAPDAPPAASDEPPADPDEPPPAPNDPPAAADEPRAADGDLLGGSEVVTTLPSSSVPRSQLEGAGPTSEITPRPASEGGAGLAPVAIESLADDDDRAYERTTLEGLAPVALDGEPHDHLPPELRPTIHRARAPRGPDDVPELRRGRGTAPVFEGRGAAPPLPTPLEPLPRTPPPYPTAWTTFPAMYPPLPPRPPLSDRPIPREEEADSAPGVSFLQALDPTPGAPTPSGMIDIGAEHTALLQRVIDGGPSGQEALGELVRHGEQVLPALMSRFPGPLRVDRHRARDLLPAASLCGPILEVLVAIRRPTLPFISGRASSPDPEVRFWATHVLGELRYPESATVLVPRLFDDDAAVRRIARRSATALVAAGAPGEPILLGLDNITRNADHPSPHRILAIETMGEIRSGAMVPALIAVLEGRAEDVADAARRALLLITRQDHARDARRWNEWWSRHGSRHRIEWLIDALMHEQPSLRRAAGDELKLITKEYFGYYDDLPKKERERAQGLYRDWWERDGKARFS